MAAERGRDRRVVVVTGGAVGIGAAIAEELGRRGAYVVTMDPVVAVDGTPQESAEQTTAERIVAAGGAARASSTSVTDEEAVRALFTGLVDEFGALDAVVNVAGISRPTGFGSGTEEDWAKILDVHLHGYLTVLRAALPLMAAAGHGRILGVTSGSGWRAADAGGYSCAKRAVASLTWQLGAVAPEGVTVNALSPIAATRMIANALSRQAPGGDGSGRSAASGGVALMAAPPPEHLGPIGAYLASDEFGWCRGNVMFSNGAEVSLVAPPRLLEAARVTGGDSLAHVVDAVVPKTFAAAEALVSNGGSVPRLGATYAGEGGESAALVEATGRVVVVADAPSSGGALRSALGARGLDVVEIAPADRGDGFPGAGAALERVARDTGGIDAVVVALAAAPSEPVGPGERWQRVLAEHAGITQGILADAAWVRAVADHSTGAERAVRVVTVTEASTSGGRSRATAAAQLARAARGATGERVAAFAIAVESDADPARRVAAEVAAHLLARDDVAALSGAELVATDDWFGLRAHPQVAGTVSYGGPELPEWLDGAVRRIVAGEYLVGEHER